MRERLTLRRTSSCAWGDFRRRIAVGLAIFLLIAGVQHLLL